jgi:adenosine/AMP kinase
MFTITMQCDVASDRVVKLKLPENIALGQHQFVFVVNDVTESLPIASFNTDATAYLNEAMELAAMANDPAMQHELAMIEHEFSLTHNDGLESI